MADLVDFGIKFRTTGAGTAAADLGKVRTAAVKATQATDDLQGKRGGGIKGLGGVLNKNSFAVTNAANQFSDLAVQIQMGTNPARALSQQLPQLTAFMGPVAAIAGVAAGVLIGLGGAFFQSLGGAESLEEGLDTLETAFERSNAAAEERGLGLDELAEKYGTVTEQVLELIAAEDRRADRLLRQALADVQLQFMDEAPSELSARLRDLANEETAGRTGKNARDRIALLREEGDATMEAAEAYEAFTDSLTGSAVEQSSAISELVLKLEAMDDTSLEGLIGQLLGLQRQLELTTEEAAGTVAAIQMLGPNAARDQNGNVYSGRGGQGGPSADDINLQRADAFIAAQSERGAAARKAARGAARVASGGGGGMTDAEAELKRLESVAEGVFKTTRTNAENLAIGITELDELMVRGLIDAETYARAIDDVNERYDEGTQAIAAFSDDLARNLNTAFASVLDGSKSVGEALLDMFDDILQEIAKKQFESLIANPLAEAASGARAGLFGGGVGAGAPTSSPRPQARPFAKGGVVEMETPFSFSGGQSGTMAEDGPEAIMPLKRGPDGRLGVAGGGGSTKVIINNYTGEKVEQKQDGQGNLEVTIGRLVARDIANGGPASKAIRKSFGIRPQTTKRG